MHDVWLIAGFGMVGYVLRKADYPWRRWSWRLCSAR